MINIKVSEPNANLHVMKFENPPHSKQDWLRMREFQAKVAKDFLWEKYQVSVVHAFTHETL